MSIAMSVSAVYKHCKYAVIYDIHDYSLNSGISSLVTTPLPFHSDYSLSGRGISRVNNSSPDEYGDV